MSDTSQGPGWWQASDGKWYPPKDAERAPAPGWWLASDGKWYPPRQDDKAPAPGWWLAADNNWYPPQPESDPALARPTPSSPSSRNQPAAPRFAGPGARPTGGPAAAPVTRFKPAPSKGPSVTPKPVPLRAVPNTRPNAKPVPLKAVPLAPDPTGSDLGPTSAPERDRTRAKNPAAGLTGSLGSASPRAAETNPSASGPMPGPGPSTMPPGSSDGLISTDHRFLARPGFEARAEAQIRTRNEQSKRDAAVLAGKRRMAATRLQGLIEQEKDTRQRELPAPGPPTGPSFSRENPAYRSPEDSAEYAFPSAPPPSPPSPRPPAPIPPPPGARTIRPSDTPPPRIGSMGHPSGEYPAIATGPHPSVGSPRIDSPLLEVKQGALAADVERIGERLAIFNDRVELHDRNNNIRQTILGEDIADVVVHKKFTGSTVTIASVVGETIIAKGLKPDQADEIRSLILRRTRPTSMSSATTKRPAPPRPSPPSGRPPAPPRAPLTPPPAAGTMPGAASRPAPAEAETSWQGRSDRPDRALRPITPLLDATELLAKLADLRQAGVLTTDEYYAKVELVHRLVRA